MEEKSYFYLRQHREHGRRPGEESVMRRHLFFLHTLFLSRRWLRVLEIGFSFSTNQAWCDLSLQPLQVNCTGKDLWNFPCNTAPQSVSFLKSNQTKHSHLSHRLFSSSSLLHFCLNMSLLLHTRLCPYQENLENWEWEIYFLSGDCWRDFRIDGLLIVSCCHLEWPLFLTHA